MRDCTRDEDWLSLAGPCHSPAQFSLLDGGLVRPRWGRKLQEKCFDKKKTVPGQNLRKCRKFFVCKCWVWCNSAVWSQGRWTRTTGRKATGPTEWQNLRRGNTFHSPVPCAVCRYEPNKIDISSFGLAGVLYGERTPGQHLCI